MFDQDYERIDPRTMALRVGLVIQTTSGAEALRAMVVDIDKAMEETEYFEDYHEAVCLAAKLDTIADLASAGPLAGLPEMDRVTDRAIIEGMDFLDNFAPLGTYYGWHRQSADCLGVWVDWNAIDTAVTDGKLMRPDGVWSYIRIAAGDSSRVTVFDCRGDVVEDMDDVDIAAQDGRVFEIEADTRGCFLFEMDDDNLVSISATTRSLTFAA